MAHDPAKQLTVRIQSDSPHQATVDVIGSDGAVLGWLPVTGASISISADGKRSLTLCLLLGSADAQSQHLH